MQGLNIHLQSIELGNLLQKNDKLRVSITTLPEGNKQAFIIDAKKLSNIHHFFTVNITDKTRKIIFVFRKKSFIQNDPIIASTIVHANLFPNLQDDKLNTEMKAINILEPLHGARDADNFNPQQRKVIGHMYIQMSLTNEFPDQNYNTRYQYSQTKNKNSYAKMDSYSNVDENQNNILFIDNY
ncbi:hypothetical protein M9Y10_033844 [Tritrichomonas musculus]|uniref:Uncharacterized protein n=1 Tax=Tritrichomonas musculus TaxID=1915356 RepID=A0ABR2KGF3_9EUKA